MRDRRRHTMLPQRGEERAHRRRVAALRSAGAPLPDDPIELAAERVCVQTGELVDRRTKVRAAPTGRR